MHVSGLHPTPSGFSCNCFSGKFLNSYCFVAVFLLFFCCLGLCDNDSAVIASVPLGFRIHASDRYKNWVSENGVFAFGFLELASNGGDDEFVVGIKYNLGGKAVNLPVWTVGGGNRVSINTTFTLAMDGRLVLSQNPSGSIIWSSNTSTLGVQKATLLDNGNLVLLSDKNDVVWESFSSPTDTLLPGQSLSYPMSLRALSTGVISSYYSLVITQQGRLELVWEHNVTYWKTHLSSSKEARFDTNGVLGLFDDHNRSIWSVSPNDYEDSSVSYRHLRIDQDGNLRIYSWDGKNRLWRAVWQAVQDQCNVFGSCGLYSICGYNSSGPLCACLSSDSLGAGTSNAIPDSSSDTGCKRLPDLGNCRMHPSMFVMKQTILYGLYPSKDDEMSLSETSCKDYCMKDVSCVAATSMNDGSGHCTVKRTAFVSGYKNPYIRAVSFLKVCSVPQAVATQGGGSYQNVAQGLPSSVVGRPSAKMLIGAIALIALLTVSVVLSVQIVISVVIYRKRKLSVRARVPFGKDLGMMNPHYSVLVRLSFNEIKEVTNGFADPLGASVFKGELPNRVPVAAKILKDVSVSEREFRVTVSTLSGTHHRNLVCVKGFCYEPGNKVLLYEYISNGSLDKWIFNGNERIGWRELDVILGVARALAYLHTECQKCITHGNLKPENILLDENMAPKVTDFGLGDFVTEQQQRAPSSSESPSERDVYMLGLVFLQIVTRKKEVAGKNVQQIVDEKFMNSDGLERITRIALWCMQDQPFLRPSIGEVVKVLEGTLSVDRPPSVSGRRQEGVVDEEEEAEIEAEEC